MRSIARTHRFADSDGGAEHRAVAASLVGTCKLNGIEPQAYPTDVITRIVNGYSNCCLDNLLPWAYAEQPDLMAMA